MKVFIFDTETTGLIENRTVPLEKQPEVIEFYGCMINLEDGKVINEVDHLIKPSKLPLPDIITKITGITDDDLKDAPPFAALADTILGALESAPALAAHNLSFDMEMIELEAERLGRKITWPRNRICTVEQTVHVKGHRLNLTALHQELFNEGFPEAHRARNDVEALSRCCVELYKREMI